MARNIFEITTPDPLGILKATAFVVKEARFVTFGPYQIPKIIPELEKSLKKKPPPVDNHFGFNDRTEKGAQLIFVEDAINFCYWPDPGKERWVIEYPKGKVTKGGWLTMTACFTRALEEGKPLWDACYLKDFDLKEGKEIFRSCNGTEIPLLAERVNCLNETGKVLLEKYDGQFKNVIQKARSDAIDLIKIVLEDFPSFYDIAELDGRRIPFLKRAQILAYDLNWMFNGKNLGRFRRINELTAFADYKIPQMLRRLGLIKYSKELADKVDNLILLKAGSKDEIEIRSATIWGVELLRQEISGATAGEIDSALWEISQDPKTQEKPYHRVRTIFY